MTNIAKEHYVNPSLDHPGINREVVDGECVTRFDSWDAFMTHVEQGTIQQGCGGMRCASESSREDWTKTADLPSALKLAREGWSEVRGQVADIRDRVKSDAIEMMGDFPEGYSLIPATRFDVAGAVVDMGRFVSGEHECMIAFDDVEEPSSGKMVRILVDTAYSSGTSTNAVIKRGAVVVALVELLDILGFSVEVWTETNLNESSGSAMVHLIRLKTAESPLDIDALLFQIAHPSSLRRVMFRSYETESARVRNVFGFGPGNYSYPAPMSHKEDLGAHVALKAASSHDQSSLNPESWITEIIRELLNREGEGQ